MGLFVPEFVNVNESSTLTIKCTLSGGESAIYSWKTADGETVEDQTTDTLVITSVNRKINGTKYQCLIDSLNNIRGNSNYALVTVNCKCGPYGLLFIIKKYCFYKV